MSNSDKKRVTIVGAGLAGALLGLRLGQRRYVVELFDRRPRDPQGEHDSNRSINLALSQRGIKALRLAGIMDDVRPLLIPMKGRMLHLENGEKTFSPYGQRDNEVIYSVSRQLLNQLLVDRAVDTPEVNVHFGCKCTGVDFDASTLTLQHVDSGTQETQPFNLLIGADGAGSRVRRSLMERLNGKSESKFLNHDYKELEIPPTTEGTWKLEKEALHIWPRKDYMLIALPNLDGSFTVTLFLPKTGNPSFNRLKDEATVNAFFESEFPSATELMPDLLKDFFDNPTGRLGTVRCAPWHYRNRALIVGDAAHAIVPFHGQGMNCAFEDCTVLDQLLDQNDDNWQRVNPRFTDQRKPDTDAIAEMAIENYITMRSTVTDPKYALKKAIGFELERRLPDVFIPRYSMVMFHDVPYAQALAKGKRQREVLDIISAHIERLEQVDWDQALKLATEMLCEN